MHQSTRAVTSFLPTFIHPNKFRGTMLWMLGLLVVPFALRAQTPLNDDCSGVIDLGPAPVCDSTIYSNVGATNSNIGFGNNPSCFKNGTASRDVWFKFTCPDTLLDFRISLNGVGANSISNPEFAVYRGDCQVDGLAELICASADVNENEVFIDIVGLTPGVEYFIRVADYGTSVNPGAGDFRLCVTAIPPTVTIDQGSSTLCSGILFDTGGPDDDYQPNENHTFTICPTNAPACITFTLDYYNLEGSEPQFPGMGDQLFLYDGNSSSGTLLAALDGSGFTPENIAGGGGVGLTVQASSGCLTVQFISDGSVQQEGWQAHWECSSSPCPAPLEMAVDDQLSNADIAEAMTSPTTTVTVHNINCPQSGYGTFKFASDDNSLGLGEGLLLTSGEAAIAIGPNDLTGAGEAMFPFQPNDPGDSMLDYLSDQFGNGTPSRDACVVELDVFVATNELTFEYVFASEEYPEYVDNDFNDIFAFLVSGPGITGPAELGNAKNIAVLPGGNIPVQINSVNNLTNWEYYRNNELSSTIQYDGMTSDYLGVKKTLTARTEVIPCNTYRLRLAIADREDEAFDSGVFIGKISGGTPELSVKFANGLDYLLESCILGVDTLYLSLSQALQSATTVELSVGGTATNGVDYILNLPGAVTFQPGQTVFAFPLTVLTDALPEGTETIVLGISGNFGCGSIQYKSLTIEIKDNPDVQVSGGDTLLVCAGNTLQLEATGANTYFWTPPSLLNNATLPNPTTVVLQQDTWFTVTGNIGTCIGVDSVFVDVINPVLSVSAANADTTICLGDSIQLFATNNAGNMGLSWTPAGSLSNSSSAAPFASPTETTQYIVNLSVGGCTLTDSITIYVDTLFMPTIAADTTVCQNYPVVLGSEVMESTTYNWQPTQGLSDPNISNPIALPDQTTTYTLTATSVNGYCTQTENVVVTVIPADIDIQGDEKVKLCLGDTLSLQAVINPTNGTVNWTPAFFVNPTTGLNVKTVPNESFTLFATTTLNGCTVTDSVQIRVDSLPESSIRREEDKTIYCPGDTIYLLSKTYEPASFPDISIQWDMLGQQLTPDSNWNMVMIATETLTMVRRTTSGACAVVDSVQIPVAVIPELTITADPSEICPGESSQIILVIDPPGGKIEWMQDATNSLSCTDCPNPIARPIQTTTYNVEIKDIPCPTSGNVTVNVLPLPALQMPNNPVLCPGDSILLNNTNQPDVTYSWTSVPPGFTSTSPTPTVTPAVTTTYRVVATSPTCETTRDVTVTVASGSLEAGSNQTVCEGAPVQLNATFTAQGGGAPVLIWQGPTGNQTTNPASFPSPGAGIWTYVAQLVYGNNCLLYDSLRVTVNPSPVLNNLVSVPVVTDSICEGTPITLRVSLSPPPAASLQWLLNGTAINEATRDSVRVTPIQTDPPQQFSVVATTTAGCSTTAGPISFPVKRCIEFPNAFTPNNDMINDTYSGLLLVGGSLEVETFQVFNRWGTKIFESTPATPSWDGKVDGKDAPTDVYAYYIRWRYPDGSIGERHGDVTLIR
ncbi:MAG: choice-of-anchor L domain-containing protein [Chitinophagales bacterium]|nr:choice-of-anchor L domain-containing protein [Chitinophagales bacterium]